MQNLERLDISLPTEMAQFILAKVEAGEYLSSSELIREALEGWLTQERLWDERMQRIRAKIADADADPRPSLSEEEVDAHLAARYGARSLIEGLS